MKYRSVFLLVEMLFSLMAIGQDYVVEKFDVVANDLTAKTKPRIDNNGRKCGLIKVYVKDAITATYGPVIGEVIDRGLEKWVYVSHDTKQIKLLFKEHMPLDVIFEDYNYPSITGQMTYTMKLKEDELKQSALHAESYRLQDYGQSEISSTPIGPVSSNKHEASQVENGLTPPQMYRKGKEAQVAGQYDEAFDWYMKAADLGDSDGLFGLGLLYYKGWGRDTDYQEALKWFKKSAEQNNAFAQEMIGWMHQYGKGLDKNYEEAFKWYRQSANKGNVLAQFDLAELYFYGRGVTKDYSKAVYWLRKSAEQGDDRAQAKLGYMFINGFGVNKDYAEAFEWISKSAAQGNSNGLYYLGQMYMHGQGVEADNEEAKKQFEKSADKGNTFSQNMLGEMYKDGIGVNKDHKKAFELFKKSAEGGNIRGATNLAYMYHKGLGTAINLDEAIKWYGKAAAKGDSFAKSMFEQLKK